MSADNVTDFQGWIVLFAIIGGIITVGTAGWRIINFLRTETKESVAIEHKFNTEQHTETRKVVRDALQNVDNKFRDLKEETKEIRNEVSKISDIRVDVAVHKERLARHDDALKYLNNMKDNKMGREK